MPLRCHLRAALPSRMGLLSAVTQRGRRMDRHAHRRMLSHVTKQSKMTRRNEQVSIHINERRPHTHTHIHPHGPYTSETLKTGWITYLFEGPALEASPREAAIWISAPSHLASMTGLNYTNNCAEQKMSVLTGWEKMDVREELLIVHDCSWSLLNSTSYNVPSAVTSKTSQMKVYYSKLSPWWHEPILFPLVSFRCVLSFPVIYSLPWSTLFFVL